MSRFTGMLLCFSFRVYRSSEGEVNVFVLNCAQEEEELSLIFGQCGYAQEHLVLTGPDLEAVNCFTEPYKVVPEPLALPQGDRKIMTVRLPCFLECFAL